MVFLWFWIVALMLAAYVVLDGFDLGVGMLYPLLGRTEEDRNKLLHSIGPVWDGNEVWLLAAGGTLFFAFPLVYASSFSGFYLPLMIVLWLLILRGLGIELRGHMDSAVWKTFFGGIFFVASALLAVFFGAALANVIRGVPLGVDHYFFLPLWTNWRVGPQPGILDWYTVIGGVVAVVALAMHGALWIAVKNSGDLRERAQRVAELAWMLVWVMTVVSLVATMAVRPSLLLNYHAYPVLFLIPILVVLALLAVELFRRKREYLKAFLASCGYLVWMLVGAAAGLFPVVLPSSISAQGDITVQEALAGRHGLHVGLVWWAIGIGLALMYFVTSYWIFRGEVSGEYH
jgi:cytochrome bd ubiquinol oxidase subunit II